MDSDAREQVTAARGAVRDSIASLQNLHALLRSTKAGPRAISGVLPEIHEGLAPLGANVGHALAHVAATGAVPAAITELVAFARARASELATAVAAAMTRDLDARARLSLEAAIERVAPDLDAARWLMDLLLASEEARVDVDLAELLEEALAPSSQRGVAWGQAVTVQVTPPERGQCSLSASPRVAIPLLHLAVAHTQSGAESARGSAEITGRCAGGTASIEVRARTGNVDPHADSLVLRAPRIVGPTTPVLALVGALTGCRAVLEPDGHARVEFGKPAE